MDSRRPRPITIRLAEERDLPVVVAIDAQDALRGSRECTAEPFPDCYGAAFREIAADPNQRLYVAEIDGHVVATAQLTFIRHVITRGLRRAVLEALFVDERFQGRGLGSALIDHAAAEARAAGCLSLELTSNKRRNRAPGFYARNGFQATHEGFKRTLR